MQIYTLDRSARWLVGVSQSPAGGGAVWEQTEGGAVRWDQQDTGGPFKRQPPPVCRRGKYLPSNSLSRKVQQPSEGLWLLVGGSHLLPHPPDVCGLQSAFKGRWRPNTVWKGTVAHWVCSAGSCRVYRGEKGWYLVCSVFVYEGTIWGVGSPCHPSCRLWSFVIAQTSKETQPLK